VARPNPSHFRDYLKGARINESFCLA